MRYIQIISLLGLLGCILTGCPAKIADNVLFLEDLNTPAALDRAGGRLVFTQGEKAIPLSPGTIVAGRQSGGVLHRVTAVQQADGQRVALLEPASLADAVASGSFMKDIEFTTEDFLGAGLLPEGESISLFSLPEKELFRTHGAVVSLAGGQVSCTPRIYLGAFYEDHVLTNFTLELSGDFLASLDFTIAVDEEAPLLFERDLLPPITHAFETHIGRVPVVGVVQLRFPIGVAAYYLGEASITTGVDISTTLSLSAQYERGFWDQTSGFSPLRFESHTPVWQTEVGTRLQYYVKTLAEVRLYESATLSACAMAYVNTDIHIAPPPETLTITGGVNTFTAFSLRVLDWNIVDNVQEHYGQQRELHYWSSAE